MWTSIEPLCQIDTDRVAMQCQVCYHVFGTNSKDAKKMLLEKEKKAREILKNKSSELFGLAILTGTSALNIIVHMALFNNKEN